MAVAKRDYYEVLGVSPDADEQAIRRAFYGLARDWHPDVADAPDAEARFRELAEAYSVLSKRESRVLYDRYGYRGRGNQGFDAGFEEAAGAPTGFQPEETQPEVRPPAVVRGGNIQTDLEVRSFEAEEGTRRLLSFHAAIRCTACMGRGSLSLPDPECEYCLGTGRKRTVSSIDVAHVLQVERCPACVEEPCPRCEGKGTVGAERRIRLRIPPGVDDGALLRLHVLPPPKDAPVVRYVAFALLLVAVALAVYLIR